MDKIIRSIKTYRPRIRVGSVVMFFGAMASIPFDVWLAGMTLQQAFATRMWIIITKTALGGWFEDTRDLLRSSYDDKLEQLTSNPEGKKVIVDTLFYSVFCSTLYLTALLVQQANWEYILSGLTFTVLSTLIIGPFIGLLIDTIKQRLGLA